ncbi:MAG TPA: PHP domain-containing protein [Bacillota bacterium]|nr:PHP domain-containing protein [Bacillota bacterium]
MKAFGDLHSHSTYSDGRGTIAENIRAASEAGLRKYAVTDHGPRNIGTGVANEDKYQEIRAGVDMLRAKYSGVEILVGAEADVISLEGEIDLSASTIAGLDLLIVGLHPFVWPRTLEAGLKFVLGNQFQHLSRGRREKVRTLNTKVVVDVLDKYPVDILSHPNLGMPLDIAETGRACAKYETAYEINTGHAFQEVEDVLTVAATGARFVVDSDAHFPASVGNLEMGVHLLEKAGIAPEQTLNLE